MDLEDFRFMLESASVDIWALMDAAIAVATIDYGDELRRRRPGIVERLYTTVTSAPPLWCRNCVVDNVREIEKLRSPSTEQEKKEEELDPCGGLFDDEQKKILENKQQLEDPNQGFRKVASDECEFSNELYRRGEKQLLCGEIQRGKISSSRTVPAAEANATAMSPSNSGEKVVIWRPHPHSHSCSLNAERLPEAERADRETKNRWHNKMKIHDLKCAWPILTESSESNRRSYSYSASDDYSGPSLCQHQPSADNNTHSLLHRNGDDHTKNGLKRRSSEEVEATAAMAVVDTNPKLFGVMTEAKRAKCGNGNGGGGGGRQNHPENQVENPSLRT